MLAGHFIVLPISSEHKEFDVITEESARLFHAEVSELADSFDTDKNFNPLVFQVG